MTESARAVPPSGRGRQAFQWLSLFALIAIPVAAIVWLLGPQGTCACSGSPTPLPPSPVVGVVVRVDSAGLGQVRGFELQVQGEGVVGLSLGPLENAAEFPSSHLTEHLASSEKVRAFYRMVDGVPTVYRLEDAPD